MKALVLEMELTPHFMAGLSLARVAKGRWPRIRKALLGERGPVCEICGFVAENPGLIDAHEVYEYPESGLVRLVRIQLLCKRCHDCKHLDHVERMGRSTRAKLLIKHFCDVNQCSEALFRKHYDSAWDDKNRIQKLYGTILKESEINYGEYQGRVIEVRRKKAEKLAQIQDEALEDYDDEPLPDHELIYSPEGALYGHR